MISIASGASVVSHVNDAGFWLVSRYLGMSEAQTLKTFTTMTTIVGLVGFAMVLIMWLLIRPQLLGGSHSPRGG